MRAIVTTFGTWGVLSALFLRCASAQGLPLPDSVRLAEFDRLRSTIQEKVWPGWSMNAAPVLLITPPTEYLVPCDTPPATFTRQSARVCARPRQFPVTLEATFPAFGPPAVIAIGEPENTAARTSTAWLFVLMHEHFHQWQYQHPGYYAAVDSLGLARGDQTGMWMLNYAFPYDTAKVAAAFDSLKQELLACLTEPNDRQLERRAAAYATHRARVLSDLSADDRKYVEFQLWQEGIARYVQIQSALAARDYTPSPGYRALGDFEPFSEYAPKLKQELLQELRAAELSKMKRVFFYSFGAAEAYLLDRVQPHWKREYFHHLLTTTPLFAPLTP